jgi:hypothetical protein
VHGSKSVERAKAEFVAFGEDEVPCDQNGLDVFQGYSAVRRLVRATPEPSLSKPH